MDDDAFNKLFTDCGDIEEYDMIEDGYLQLVHKDNRCKGFGFVTFANEDAMNKAIAMDGTVKQLAVDNAQEYEGRNINVSKAKERNSAPRERKEYNNANKLMVRSRDTGCS